MVLEESRTTTIARNKAITAAPARDGLTIIIFDSVEGYARTAPNGIKNKGWIYIGFLTGATLKISEIFVIIIGKVFRLMKLEELMAGEDSKPAGTCSEFAGTHFTIRKIKF
jgi:hypothetical protein